MMLSFPDTSEFCHKKNRDEESCSLYFFQGWRAVLKHLTLRHSLNCIGGCSLCVLGVVSLGCLSVITKASMYLFLYYNKNNYQCYAQAEVKLLCIEPHPRTVMSATASGYVSPCFFKFYSLLTIMEEWFLPHRYTSPTIFCCCCRQLEPLIQELVSRPVVNTAATCHVLLWAFTLLPCIQLPS